MAIVAVLVLLALLGLLALFALHNEGSNESYKVYTNCRNTCDSDCFMNNSTSRGILKCQKTCNPKCRVPKNKLAALKKKRRCKECKNECILNLKHNIGDPWTMQCLQNCGAC